MFEDIPVDVGHVYEGERIRSANMFVELAGPKSVGAELLRVVEKVDDGKIEVIGPDTDEMIEGESYKFVLQVNVQGDLLEEEIEGVLETKIHELSNYIQGYMHLNHRDQIWCRISKEAFESGFKFKHIGKVLGILLKEEFPIIQGIEIKISTDPKEVEKFVEKAMEIYEKRDAMARELSDEDVDVFYGCVMCQSFAPTHVCIVSPDRSGLCGALTWFDCRASAKIDPEGPVFEVNKGNTLDDVRGEYDNVNDVVADKSQGTFNRVYLHSVFEYPHTSCGCFEAVAFYIPDLDGIGIVDRSFKGETPLGVPFSSMAGQCSGGKQVEGFTGICIEYMRSPKFLQADGGYERVIWLPKELKDLLDDFIPEEIKDKIPTEEDATKIKDIKEFLSKADHPIIIRWEETEAEKIETKKSDDEIVMESTIPQVAYAPEISVPASGEFRIILKNAKIYAEKVIIRRNENKFDKS
ncbi:MAG: CO dehydrogenase/CO-methylating acetyl-CoA synthase complex subunit beta [Euryarchaeota archaeon]|nr:CO dehydrogenase/CO-methylating acetyl-CoA synthase complex subunit beta [Euryarchaeota archaeon]